MFVADTSLPTPSAAVQVPAHKAAIQQLGPCAIHRRSFEPVKSMTGWAGYGQKAKAAAAAAAMVAVGTAREERSRTEQQLEEGPGPGRVEQQGKAHQAAVVDDRQQATVAVVAAMAPVATVATAQGPQSSNEGTAGAAVISKCDDRRTKRGSRTKCR
jgi:Tfp pilus assembly protein PilE